MRKQDSLFITDKYISLSRGDKRESEVVFRKYYNDKDELIDLIFQFFNTSTYDRIFLNKRVKFHNRNEYKILKMGMYLNDNVPEHPTTDEVILEEEKVLSIVANKEYVSAVRDLMKQYNYVLKGRVDNSDMGMNV